MIIDRYRQFTAARGVRRARREDPLAFVTNFSEQAPR
jgi:hypothetical protein